jgi:hypothetical protein
MIARLCLGLVAGFALGYVVSDSPARAAHESQMVPASAAELSTAKSCLPRGSACSYSHDCCSRICRKIKGSQECS